LNDTYTQLLKKLCIIDVLIQNIDVRLQRDMYRIFQNELDSEKVTMFLSLSLIRSVNNDSYDRYDPISNRCRRKEVQPLSIKQLFPSFQAGVNWSS